MERRFRYRKLLLAILTLTTVLLSCWAFVFCVRPEFLFEVHEISHSRIRHVFRGQIVESFGVFKGSRRISNKRSGGFFHFEFSGLTYVQVGQGNNSKVFWGRHLTFDDHPDVVSVQFD